MERAVIFEFNPSGHRMYYIRSLLQALFDLKLHPILAVPAWVPSRAEYRANLGDLTSAVETHHVQLPTSCNSRRARYASIVASLSSDTVFDGATRIYLPSGDGVAQLAGLRSFWRRDRRLLRVMRKTEVLLLGGNHGYPAGFKRSVHDRVSRSLIKPHLWRRVFHLDPYQFEFLARETPGFWNLMPDPVGSARNRDPLFSRELLGIAPGGTCLGCAGSIEVKKGSDLLLAAFRNAIPKLPHDSFLLLAGLLDTTTKKLVATTYRDLVSTGRIVVLDRFLSKSTFDAAIHSMDIVCLPYRKAFRSSGIFLHAVSAGKRLITSKDGWLGRTMELLRQGECVDVLDHEQLTAAIVQAVGAPSALNAQQANRRQKFLQYHSHENFRSTWTSLLRDELGLPQGDGLRTWNWVSEDAVPPPKAASMAGSREWN